MVKYYDTEGDKNISYEDFIKDLRETLKERRQRIVDKAYNKLDPESKGKINSDVINQNYDVTLNKDYIDGNKSREEIV